MRKVMAMLLAVMLLCTVLPMAALADHDDECIQCGHDLDDRGDHDRDGLCNKCDPDYHRHDYEWVVTKVATCIEKGEETKTCTICGKTDGTRSTNRDKNKHNIVTIKEEVPSTCTTHGTSKETNCSWCNKVHKGGTSLPLADHQYKVTTPAVAATCVVEGKTAIETCSTCGVATRGGESLGKNPSNHVNVSDWITDKEPTCTEKGNEHKECNDCGAVVDNKEMEAKGHIPGEWNIDKVATCVEEGSRSRKCSVCGGNPETETIAFDSKNHVSVSDWITTQKPTCEEAGSEHKVCDACNVEVEVREIEALNHDYELTAEIPATCEKDGSKSYTCKNDPAHTKTETVKALGHDMSEAWTNDNDYHWHVCLRNCGHIEGKDKHVSEKWIDNGDTHGKVCDICEKSFEQGNAHSYGEFVTIQEMTCTQDKIEERICKDCGHSDRKTTPTTGHNIEKFPGTPATCTEDGVTDFEKCANPGCDYQAGNEVIPALGHEIEKIPGRESSCVDHGWKPYEKCSRPGCDYTTYEELPLADHDPDEKWTDCGDGEHHHIVCDVCGIELERGHHDWHKGEKHWGHTHYYCDDCGAEKKVDNHHDHHEYNDGSNPKTSDDSNIFAWVVVMSVSAVALVGTSVYGLKKRNQ